MKKLRNSSFSYIRLHQDIVSFNLGVRIMNCLIVVIIQSLPELKNIAPSLNVPL